MADLATEIRVFLSSTFVDLREVRAQVSYRLRQILGAQLITMESFGSDAAPPEISSIRRVRSYFKTSFCRSNLLILNGLNRVLKSALIKRRHLSGGRSEHILRGNHVCTTGLQSRL
jgi:hypothetical protein